MSDMRVGTDPLGVRRIPFHEDRLGRFPDDFESVMPTIRDRNEIRDMLYGTAGEIRRQRGPMAHHAARPVYTIIGTKLVVPLNGT